MVKVFVFQVKDMNGVNKVRTGSVQELVSILERFGLSSSEWQMVQELPDDDSLKPNCVHAAETLH